MAVKLLYPFEKNPGEYEGVQERNRTYPHGLEAVACIAFDRGEVGIDCLHGLTCDEARPLLDSAIEHMRSRWNNYSGIPLNDFDICFCFLQELRSWCDDYSAAQFRIY